ncbi:hypothetical protein GQ53DRAFT_649366 [Thozetella sp. PMI_491]|nr:hypothetical protein GQ53DRAFT_649366 [Thozetella sp. PMI_491]
MLAIDNPARPVAPVPSQTTTPPQGATPKKFATTAPVKNACLSCRASRTRCDGGHPCVSCKNRSRECTYRPSRRGGARVRKKPYHSYDTALAGKGVPRQDVSSDVHFTIAVQSYIDPGAGLSQLQDYVEDSDFIFDSLFMSESSRSDSRDNLFSPVIPARAVPTPMVRTYKNENDILDAYYIFIHPFFPILPPPTSAPTDIPHSRLQNQADEVEDAFESSSPVSLAISAILALIPCPHDTNYQAQESLVFRRNYSQYLAQSAVESIEMETEIPDSSLEPPRALESSEGMPRGLFHPEVPLELESIIALDLLSVYEYAQRGNLKRMQNRAGQALMLAMGQLLHLDTEESKLAETKRRVWWMTYVCVCQASIVSSSKPTFEVFAPSFTRKFPSIESDPQAFTDFIQAQQAILGATQFVVELNNVVNGNGDMTRIYSRMQELETFLSTLSDQADAWNITSTIATPMDPTEEILSRSLRCMARIKINSARIKVHRYCAFFDLPIFSGKHCDFKSTSSRSRGDEGLDEPRRWPSCSCSSVASIVSSDASSVGLARSTDSGGSPTTSAGMAASFPFSSHQSAKICLKSALNIARSFDELPYPNPSGQLCEAPCSLSPTSSIVSPRTMPSFACCAMQCAYALLMVHHKTKSLYPQSEYGSSLVESLLKRLHHGLASVLSTLENYAAAFEALGGMRGSLPFPLSASPKKRLTVQ